MQYRSIGICVKADQPQLAALVAELTHWLRDRGLEVWLDAQASGWGEGNEIPFEAMPEKVDLIVVLGGDGTLLAAARAIDDRDIPILGVNLGTLGFLAETSSDELLDAMDDVLNGRFTIASRMRLEVVVERDGEARGRYLALNDAVIGKSALSRMVDVETRADGVDVTTYHADGLIVATPTGSSAYSLSAGGPLLLPEFGAIVLTPIRPHTLTQRPLVLPDTCKVELRIQNARGGEVHLTVDGQVGQELTEGDTVRLCRARYPARLLAPPARNRFEVMRQKLRWGER